MPFTSAYPSLRTGEPQRDVDGLRDNFIAFLDEINHALENINAGTIKGKLSAATIEADSITTNKARIKSAQIANLIADKIAAGTLNLSTALSPDGKTGITIVGDGADRMEIDESSLVILYDDVIRLFAGKDKDTGKFMFLLLNEDGTTGICMGEDGNAYFSGNIEASTITGGSITGSVIKTAESGERFELLNDGLFSYDSAGRLDGWALIPTTDIGGILRYYRRGNVWAEFATDITGYNGGTPTSHAYTNMKLYVSGGHLELRTLGSYDTYISGNTLQLGSTLSNGVYINGKVAATDDQIVALQSQINSLSHRISALGG